MEFFESLAMFSVIGVHYNLL